MIPTRCPYLDTELFDFRRRARQPIRHLMYRSFFVAFALVASTLTFVVSAPAQAAEDEVYSLVFPVVGDTYYSDTFGACRDGCSRRHIGNDIMTYGLKGVPVVAAHDGVIRNTSTALGRACCAIWGITADDGWETWYIHLNNDSPDTDDGKGWGFAPGIEPGVRVEAGQLIGWVGDSGNAERVAPMLHFELRRPDGTAISPYASLQAATRVDLPRLAGADRFVTASEIALDGYPEGASTVFVTTGRAFPDALAAGAVGAAKQLPILLTEPTSLPSASRSALSTLDPDRIVIIGGPEAVSEDVAAALSEYAPVERIGGVNRYETARMVAEAQFADPSVVYLAYGYSYPDAVSAAVAAGIDAGPLMLTDDDALTGFTRQYLASLSDVRVVAVGNAGAIPQKVLDEVVALSSVSAVERITADDPSGISIAVSRTMFPDGADLVYLATSLDFADALAGASLAGTNRTPVLLLSDEGLDAVDAEIQRLGASETIVLGGPEAVSYGWIVSMWNRSVGNTMPTWK